jgi:hypothetical protein
MPMVQAAVVSSSPVMVCPVGRAFFAEDETAQGVADDGDGLVVGEGG